MRTSDESEPPDLNENAAEWPAVKHYGRPAGAFVTAICGANEEYCVPPGMKYLSAINCPECLRLMRESSKKVAVGDDETAPDGDELF